MAYTVIVSAVTGLLFGLAPAIQAARVNLSASLKDGGRGAGGSRARNRLRAALVVAEVALSLMLLVGASMFVRSIVNIYSADAGIDTRSLMTLRLFMSGDAYATPAAVNARIEDVVRRVEALPGVDAAFGSNLVPYAGGGGRAGIVPEGMTVEAGQEPQISFFAATRRALDTLGQRVLVRPRLHGGRGIDALRRRAREPGARRTRLARPLRHRRTPIPVCLRTGRRMAHGGWRGVGLPAA